jgi:hypothetical protein
MIPRAPTELRLKASDIDDVLKALQAQQDARQGNGQPDTVMQGGHEQGQTQGGARVLRTAGGR